VVLVRISFGSPVPEPAALLIPPTTARVHENNVPATLLVGVYENTVLLQMAGGVSELVNIGEGFTVIVNENGVPVQLLAEGVIVIVAVMLVVPALVAVKEGIFPVPFAANPIPGVSFTQEKVVPETGPVKNIIAVVLPLQ
jgi:hypothetical protein